MCRKPKSKRKKHVSLKVAKRYVKRTIRSTKKKGYKPAPPEAVTERVEDNDKSQNTKMAKEQDENVGKKQDEHEGKKQIEEETKRAEDAATETEAKTTINAGTVVQGDAVVLFFSVASVRDRQAARLRPEALRLWFDRTNSEQQSDSGETDENNKDKKDDENTDNATEGKTEGKSTAEGKSVDSEEKKTDVDESEATVNIPVARLLNADAYEHQWAEVTPMLPAGSSMTTAKDDAKTGLSNLIKAQRQAIERVWFRVSSEGVRHSFECLRATYTRIMHRLNSHHSRTTNSKLVQNLRGEVVLLLPVSDCLHHCGVNLRLLGKVRYRFLALQASVERNKSGKSKAFTPKRGTESDDSKVDTTAHEEQPIQLSDFLLQDFIVPAPMPSLDPDVVAGTAKANDKTSESESNSDVAHTRTKSRSVVAEIIASTSSVELSTPTPTTRPNGTSLYTTSDQMVCNQCLLADMVARVLRGRVRLLLRKHYAVPGMRVRQDKLGQRSEAHATVWELLRDFFGSGPLVSDEVGGRGPALDWNCETCGRANTHRRQVCRICGKARPEAAVVISAESKALEQRSCDLWSVNVKVWLLDKFGPWALSMNETGKLHIILCCRANLFNLLVCGD